ncbi:MAG: hypothetical protein ACRCVV_11050 [Shewanella sp.]
MNFDQIKKRIQLNLRNAFSVTHVKQEPIDSNTIRDPRIASELWLECISFVLNNEEKHFMFYVRKHDGLFFTRSKEGIKEELLGRLRYYDFTFELTDDPEYRNDITGKLLESIIGREARQQMHNTFNFWKEEAQARGNNYFYTLGYKVTGYNKRTMSFTADFELNVRKEDEDEFTSYRGQFVDGSAVNIKASWNNTYATLSDIFY